MSKPPLANKSPAPSKFLGGLNVDDEKIFIARGKSALRNSLRGNEQKYSSGESICRYSSQVGLPKLVELLEKNELAEDQLKLFLLLNAEAISKGVFRAYPELEKMVSKYK